MDGFPSDGDSFRQRPSWHIVMPIGAPSTPSP
jgi:hypothetical protein